MEEYTFYNRFDHTARSDWDKDIKIQWWTEDSFPERHGFRSDLLDFLRSTDWFTKVVVVLAAATLALVNWN